MRPRNESRKIEVYEYVTDCIKNKGVAPTTDEICASLGMAKSTVSKYMNRLIDEGLLTRRGRYRTVSPDSVNGYTRMAVIGRVACGKPILATEDIEGYLPIDELSLGGGEFFGLIADGDSMIGAGIDDGDVVYIRRQSTADEGDIVVAMITDGISGEPTATLKRFYKDTEHKLFILRAENEKYPDIIVSDLTILGVARRVLKNI